jgi:nitrogen fixation NifU-like protein
MDVYGIALDDNGPLDLQSDWLGIRFFREAAHGWHFSAEGVYQFGDVGTTDISAWAFEGFVGHTWDTPTNPGIHFGITAATGEDFSNTDADQYFSLAGDVHPRLGLGDWIDASNLVAYNLGYTGSKDNHSWGVDLFKFNLEEDNGGSSDLGFEGDLWYNYQYSKNLVAQFAVAYFNPGNVISDANDAVGTGIVGAPACGDVMKLQIKVNGQGVIEDAKFKTYGCGSAIASSSLLTEWVKGKTLSEAGEIKNTQIAEELALPPVKIHCSVLAEDAIKAAIADYQGKRAGAEQQRSA